EYLDALGRETPEGWVVTGYPWYAIDTPEHKAFLAAYQKRYDDYPRLGTMIGYNTILSLAAGIDKADSTDSEALVEAFKDLKLDTPVGPITYRSLDHQSTMGAYVGTLALQDGKGVMTDIRYVDGATVLPDASFVSKLRPA